MIERIYLQLIIINSEVWTFPIVTFSMFVCLRWLYYHMLSVSYIYIYIYPRKAGLFLYHCAVLWCVQIIEYVEFAHYTTSLSSLCRCILKYWTGLSQLSQSSWNDCENTCKLYYHHQIGSMNRLPLLGVKLWNNGMRCMFFYVLMMTSWRGNTFLITRPLWRESTSHRWIPLGKGQ